MENFWKANDSFDNVLSGAILFKQVTYEIIIENTIGAEKLSIEMREDFAEWIKAKAIELGLGKHHEYYCYDEMGDFYVGVSFIVNLWR